MTLLEYTLQRDSYTPLGGSELRWEPVCRRTDLEHGWAEAALAGEHQVALVDLGGALYAVSHIDPHTGAPVMARGIVGSRHVAGEGHRPTITSPLLKQVYDLGTGRCYSDPALYLQCYATRVVDGVIEVEVSR